MLDQLEKTFEHYKRLEHYQPLFICGNALDILRTIPSQSIDFCMTSPPYWNQREYDTNGIGLETHYQLYLNELLAVFLEIQRVLKDTGSFWLNIGDTYLNKSLIGLPWRLAIHMIDQQGWILRNDVIWNKLKGPDNSKDKLRPTHEYIFHFVKQRHYFYDLDAIRTTPRQAKILNGAIVSATGVSGVKYKRQIELSTSLTIEEKANAFEALNLTLERLQAGEISDFRMVIRKQQRTTHSNAKRVSGRARELEEKGYYFLFYHPNGSKPSDVWDIIPEDTTQRGNHYAAYPEDLCRIPLLSTCPVDGIALDPFCGTGTTNLVAMQLCRKSVGIDMSTEYIQYAEQRCKDYNA
jgi:DNA modification methylase